MCVYVCSVFITSVYVLVDIKAEDGKKTSQDSFDEGSHVCLCVFLTHLLLLLLLFSRRQLTGGR